MAGKCWEREYLVGKADTLDYPTLEGSDVEGTAFILFILEKHTRSFQKKTP